MPAPDRPAPEGLLDGAKAEAFGGHLMSILGGSLLSSMVDIGHRTGLFAAAAEGWATSEQLAARAGLTERYVREWLGAVTTGGIVEYDEANEAFFLPPEHAALLTAPAGAARWRWRTPSWPSTCTRSCRPSGRAAGSPTRRSRQSSPTRWMRSAAASSTPCCSMATFRWRRDSRRRWWPAPRGRRGLRHRSRAGHPGAGLSRLDVRRLRASTSTPSPGRGPRPPSAGLKNVTFEVLDVARLTPATPFDVVLVFDALHDQAEPGTVLARIHDALVPGGLLFMREPHAADTLAGNLANPMAPVFYSISTLHCLTVSLAHGGAGIGAAFGEQLARRMLTEAGFGPADVHPAPGQPFDAVYVTRTAR